MSRLKNGVGYTWRFENGKLCNWCVSEKQFLLDDGSPSSSAVPIRVNIVPYGSVGRQVNRLKAELRVILNNYNKKSVFGFYKYLDDNCDRLEKLI